MANTLTNLIPDLYAGLDAVSRELVGYIPAVARNSSAERAAVNDNVRYHIAPDGNVSNVSPAMAIPEPTDQTIGSGTISITKARAAEFGFVGEEQLGLNNGAGYRSVQADMFAQALRALTNEIETDVAAAAAAAASRATGTAGTTPFASGVGDSAQARKILDDNGAPNSDRQLVINTAAGANLRTNTQLTKANEAADSTMLRQGVLLDMHGFAIAETGQDVSHTAGSLTGTVSTDATGYAAGSTSITLETGTGEAIAINAGDVITFSGDSNKYIATADLDVAASSSGTLTIQEPGLREAIAASATDVAVGSDYSANVAFYRGAIQLATRAPALPQESDAAIDSMMLTDPRSGLSFEVRVYGGYRKVRYEVAMAWGVKVVQPRHTALLLG